MIVPSRADFCRMVRFGSVAAVTKSIPCDLETPVSCFLKLAGKSPNAFLLESAEQEERIGRYSFIGWEPQEILVAKQGRLESQTAGKKKMLADGQSLCAVLESKLNSLRLANPGSLPDFCGGWVGYFGYENVSDFESVTLTAKKGPDIPDSIFFLVKEFVVFDHFRKTLTLVSLVPTAAGTKAVRAYKTALKCIARIEKLLGKRLIVPKPKNNKKKYRFISNLSQLKFIDKVKKIKRYISAGDCIQAVLSQRFKMPAVRNDFQIYRALRSINPSPHMFYFRCGSIRLIGSSPELLVKKQGMTAEVRPIAGTRPRGNTAQQDTLFENQLKQSKKEIAEHLMLVDLGRNDLGRVCRYQSVAVKKFARVERFSHVMHLVTDVAGTLKPHQTAFDLLKATFPAGTVTGAPKIRAMQIINELEPEKRGPYAGCLGYFSFNRNMEMCLMIRTLVQDARRLYLQAGAGIVQDSTPRKEFQETVNKAKALFKAVEKRNIF